MTENNEPARLAGRSPSRTPRRPTHNRPAEPGPPSTAKRTLPVWSPPSMASGGGCATGCAPHRYSSPSRFLAALTTAWDDRLDALQHYLQPP